MRIYRLRIQLRSELYAYHGFFQGATKTLTRLGECQDCSDSLPSALVSSLALLWGGSNTILSNISNFSFLFVCKCYECLSVWRLPSIHDKNSVVVGASNEPRHEKKKLGYIYAHPPSVQVAVARSVAMPFWIKATKGQPQRPAYSYVEIWSLNHFFDHYFSIGNSKRAVVSN